MSARCELRCVFGHPFGNGGEPRRKHLPRGTSREALSDTARHGSKEVQSVGCCVWLGALNDTAPTIACQHKVCLGTGSAASEAVQRLLLREARVRNVYELKQIEFPDLTAVRAPDLS